MSMEMARLPFDDEVQAAPDLPLDRGYEPSEPPEPSFRRLGQQRCAWCHKAFERRSHGGDRGIYHRDACRANARRAPKKERQRRHEEARKLMGLATAAENNAAQREIARWAALKAFEKQGGKGIVSDVRAWCAEREIDLEWSKPWTGSVFQHPWFTASGDPPKAAYHAGSSARKVTVWKLTGEALRVLSELRRLGG